MAIPLLKNPKPYCLALIPVGLGFDTDSVTHIHNIHSSFIIRMAEEIHGATGTVVRVRNHSRKNENAKETYLLINATMLYLKDVIGISHKTDIFLFSRVNGREFFIIQMMPP